MALRFKTIIFILILTFIPLLVTSLLRDSLSSKGVNYGSDSNVYWDLAQNLYYRQRYAFSPGLNYPGIGVRSENHQWLDNLYVLPGYPLLLSFFVKLGMDSGPYILAFGLYGVLSISVFAIGQRLFAQAISAKELWIWFGLYHLLNPTWIVQLRALAQDLAATVFVGLFIWCAVRWFQNERSSVKNSLGLLFSTAGALVVRTNLLAFVFPVLVLLGLMSWRKKKKGHTGVALAGLFISVLMMGLWGLHMKGLTDRFSLGANMGYGLYVNYVYANVPREKADAQITDVSDAFEAALHKGQPINTACMTAALTFQSLAIHFIQAHARVALGSMAHNIKTVFIGRDYFWLPQLLLVRLQHKPLEIYAGRSYYDQMNGLSKMAAAAALLITLISYLIYIGVPALCLLLFPFRKILFPAATDSEGHALTAVFCISAIIFLIATALVLGQARYRMPVQPVFYLCVLGYWVLLRKRFSPWI